MKAVSRRRALPLLGAAASGVAGGATADTGSGVQGIIDGAFILEEWHIDDNVYRPPQVDGRAVFLNSAVVVVLINKAHEEKQIHRRPFGRLHIERGTVFVSVRQCVDLHPNGECDRGFSSTPLGRNERLRPH
jgi:hypothetical protein